MKKKYKVMLFVIGLLIISMSMLGFHYGLYKMSSANEYLAVKTSGCLDIIYSDDEIISLVNPKSISDEDGMTSIPRTITIGNNCSNNELVTLYLDIYNDSTIDDSKIRTAINGDIEKEAQTLSDINNILGKDNILRTYKLFRIELEPGETKRFNLRFWLSYNSTISLDKNTFHASYYVASNSVNNKRSISEEILNNNYLENIVDYSYTAITNNNLIKINNSYYYRGVVDNNYLEFAGKKWRIVGLNEDNSVKLIYDDEPLYSKYSNSSSGINSLVFNNDVINNYLSTWYNDNLGLYDSYIVSRVYCNDTSNTVSNMTKYGSYLRNFEGFTPSIECLATDIENSGSIALKIGLLTADEVAIAGATSTLDNTSFYLYNGLDFLTMSPAYKGWSSSMIIVNANGKLDVAYPNLENSIRPVINIIGNLEVMGLGTKDMPYKLNI